MLYLLDANALITAHNTWYGLNRVPEFWKWLHYHGAMSSLKMPAEIYSEVESGNDELAAWMKQSETKRTLLLDEEIDARNVQTVLAQYGKTLTEADLITIGQDPFLIAAGLGHSDRCIVTAEVSKPTRSGPRRHVPDVCNDCQIRWIHPIKLIADLNFSTTWDDFDKLL
ncbi:DUF4411 family protein [Sphingomonas qomolangmaensis]|uniref:DUF4411 family protein n=1 Tax=Sphingomonas qomolangmaensis TaxID=2918765 RepID=A0ABY5L972_9SPHN|nr:DUF4411 family protein [Sphingomonas qomolangmaensis]UUL83500.1 DUF4411 family protein [Sphingomonas qomolangmaensis]